MNADERAVEAKALTLRACLAVANGVKPEDANWWLERCLADLEAK